jgi:hypothetical protein
MTALTALAHREGGATGLGSPGGLTESSKRR